MGHSNAASGFSKLALWPVKYALSIPWCQYKHPAAEISKKNLIMIGLNKNMLPLVTPKVWGNRRNEREGKAEWPHFNSSLSTTSYLQSLPGEVKTADSFPGQDSPWDGNSLAVKENTTVRNRQWSNWHCGNQERTKRCFARWKMVHTEMKVCVFKSKVSEQSSC